MWTLSGRQHVGDDGLDILAFVALGLGARRAVHASLVKLGLDAVILGLVGERRLNRGVHFALGAHWHGGDNSRRRLRDEVGVGRDQVEAQSLARGDDLDPRQALRSPAPALRGSIIAPAR